MGCPCSARNHPRQQQQPQPQPQQQATTSSLPNRGYYWTGPDRSAKADPAPASDQTATAE